MASDEKHTYDPSDYETLPIPSYEEATSSRPPSTNPLLRPSEPSTDAERQGFLSPSTLFPPSSQSRRRNGYQAPSVQSARNSVDSDELDALEGLVSDDDGDSGDDEERELRREVEEMEEDLEGAEGDSRARRRARNRSEMRSRFQKRWAGLSTTLSSITSPFRGFKIPWPSFQGITDRVNAVPDQYKPGWAIIARLFGLFVLVSLLYVLVVMEVFPGGKLGMSGPFNMEWVRTTAQGSVDELRIRGYLRHVTSYSHIAGSEGDFYLAQWVENHFKGAGMDSVEMKEYQVYLNYPKENGRRVAIIDPPELKWEAKLEEEPAYKNPTAQQQNTMVFHGHSRAGNVTGPLIYVNYGSRADFKALHDSGIIVKGSIALVRYYGSQGDRALKVKAAEEWGCVGALIYSDPAEDGFVKGDVWPKGRWRPSDGVQRGAVSLMSWVVGDVLTPGWASVVGAKRVSKDNNPGLVNIPSLPLAWRDAQKLLQALKGHGQQLPEEWAGGVPEVDEWWSGDLHSPVVNLLNEQDENDKQPIWNVMGRFEGTSEKEKKVIVGNHRDSWCFGSADPGSGTAIMLEVVNILGQLREQGWRPLRTIEVASWDGEEYNLIGSTEYVEDNITDLRNNGVAYLNVDVGVVGNKFEASASPLFKRALHRVLSRVADPFQRKSLMDIWHENKSKLGGLGAGSDYVAFQDIAGTSSIDFGFVYPDGQGFPYHSCYETFEWMEQYGDPGFQYHKVLAQVWVLLILEFSQEPIVPFDMEAYAEAVGQYTDDLVKYSESKGAPWEPNKEGAMFNAKPLFDAVNLFKAAAKNFAGWENAWVEEVFGRNRGFEREGVTAERIAYNNKMSRFETDLLDIPRDEKDKDQHGVPGREQFKHVIFGPQLWSGYDEAFFPSIRDAIDAQNWTSAQFQLEKVARILKAASEKLMP
ncbi:carboxypeptidase [Aulographum hederae CBS 113979]|uniref:Carboxypeptidase n=1 Tax=Aulographum hederae CBS 113979 TaxID=1176131 RepID=A0A6G1H297_9PEZI|nr:carboxypeptidase [Aulographum hederae CBS 113979]